MVTFNILTKIIELLNPHKNRVLTIAQSSLSEHQFQAFKKLFLDEMGDRGFEKELKQLLEKHRGMDRDGLD